MPEYQNPAGRLHDLLTRFAEHPRNSAVQAWALVLDIGEDEVAMHLGDVASLLRSVLDAAQETGLDAFDPIPAHLPALSRSIFPLTSPLNDEARKVAPDPQAMQALKMLSAYLDQTAPEGMVTGEDELDALRASLRQLIEM